MAIPFRIFIGLLLLVILSPARAAGLEDISQQDSSSALRQALTQGASAAVASLGRPDGFLGNPKVKIPLPESLQKAERLMRKLRHGQARRRTRHHHEPCRRGRRAGSQGRCWSTPSSR